jgi:hypothetical protein
MMAKLERDRTSREFRAGMKGDGILSESTSLEWV